MSYQLQIEDAAHKDIALLHRTGDKAALRKLETLLDELREHPTTGTGRPKPLTGDKSGLWSRRITQKHRLIYEILEQRVIVLIVAAYGHYDDK